MAQPDSTDMMISYFDSFLAGAAVAIYLTVGFQLHSVAEMFLAVLVLIALAAVWGILWHRFLNFVVERRARIAPRTREVQRKKEGEE